MSSCYTCVCLSRWLRRLHDVSVHGLGTGLLLFDAWGMGFNDCIHVLHQFELPPPQIFIFDELPSCLLLFFLLTILFCFQSVQQRAIKGSSIQNSIKTHKSSEILGPLNKYEYTVTLTFSKLLLN